MKVFSQIFQSYPSGRIEMNKFHLQYIKKMQLHCNMSVKIIFVSLSEDNGYYQQSTGL